MPDAQTFSRELPALSHFELRWRRALPRWLQWLMCFPIAAIAALILGWIMMMFTYRWVDTALLEYALRCIYPSMVFVLFLGCLWTLLPAAKYEVCIAMLTLRALVILVLVALTVFRFASPETFEDEEHKTLSWWVMLLGEGLAIGLGIGAVKTMKEEYDNGGVEAERST